MGWRRNKLLDQYKLKGVPPSILLAIHSDIFFCCMQLLHRTIEKVLHTQNQQELTKSMGIFDLYIYHIHGIDSIGTVFFIKSPLDSCV
mmetsp:Transcript_56444/g.83911  ORF Transcript_56444/g.83911 Transcript_56444/m.83911 type:complete len:88 (-) Transcript_56444:162-425(-)